MKKEPKKLGEILIEHGLITPEQLKYALEEQSRTNKFLGTILLKKGHLKESDLLKALSKQFNLPLVALRIENINWDFVKKFSAVLMLDHKCLPLCQDEFSVTIAITNPLDVWAIKKCEEAAADLKLKLVLTYEKDIEKAVSEYKNRVRPAGEVL